MNDFRQREIAMLTEERYSRILELVNEQGSITIHQLMEELNASESTIRRDLNAMDKKELLTKVHGGAISKTTNVHTKDEEVFNRKHMNQEDKDLIAKYAAAMIEDDDFVYLDAGTTTEQMIDYIKAKNVNFVTNAITHAKKLSDKGYRAYILGGEFKSTTEAIVGEEAVEALEKYNFTKGFWGTNGISLKNGYTTPELKEAMVKKKSMENCKTCYILADPSKFNEISSIKFADYKSAIIITTKAVSGYRDQKNIVEAKE